MSLIVRCTCGQAFQAKPELAGRQLPCPSCGNTLQVPHPGAVAPAAHEFSAPVSNPMAAQPNMMSQPTMGQHAAPYKPGANKKLYIAIGVSVGVVMMFVVGYFGFAMVNKQIRRAKIRAEVRKKMATPEWREKHLGEKQGPQTYRSAMGRYQLTMPGPTKSQLKSTTWVASYETNDEAFLVSHQLVPKLMSVTRGEIQFEQMAKDTVAAMNCKVTGTSRFKLDEHDGIDATFVNNPGQKELSGRVRLLVTGDHYVFQLTWIATPPKAETAAAKEMFDSFELTSPRPQMREKSPLGF